MAKLTITAEKQMMKAARDIMRNKNASNKERLAAGRLLFKLLYPNTQEAKATLNKHEKELLQDARKFNQE